MAWQGIEISSASLLPLFWIVLIFDFSNLPWTSFLLSHQIPHKYKVSGMEGGLGYLNLIG